MTAGDIKEAAEAPATTSPPSAEAEAVETTPVPAAAECEAACGGKETGFQEDDPVQALVPELIAQHKRFSAWIFVFQERFHRVPFNAKEVIEEDTKNFWAWLESDLNTTAKQEEVIKKAFEHPLWKEYCLDCIENGAEDKVYYGGGISDIEDVSAEVEAWQSFLEQKGLKTQAPEEETTTGPTPSPVSVPTAAADATC